MRSIKSYNLCVFSLTVAIVLKLGVAQAHDIENKFGEAVTYNEIECVFIHYSISTFDSRYFESRNYNKARVLTITNGNTINSTVSQADNWYSIPSDPNNLVLHSNISDSLHISDVNKHKGKGTFLSSKITSSYENSIMIHNGLCKIN